MEKNNKLPFVSIVTPSYNEKDYLEDCLSSIINQSYPEDRYEIIVSDGMSTDSSRDLIIEFKQKFKNLILLDNQKINTPSGLNLGIKKSSGEVVIILGTHSKVGKDFISTNIKTLDEEKASCVGGTLKNLSKKNLGEVIAMAMSSPFGVGGAKFRYGKKKEWVDSVAFGAYRREVFDKIGLFDEKLVYSEDEDLNWRIRDSGEKILLNPEIEVYYYPRENLIDLFKQYFRYGFSKINFIKKHPKGFRLRYIVPSLFVISLLLSLLFWIISIYFLYLFFIILGAYILCSLTFSFIAVRRKRFINFFLLPPIFLTLHISYGIGFILGMFRSFLV